MCIIYQHVLRLELRKFLKFVLRIYQSSEKLGLNLISDIHASKIRNTGITDKWAFRHTSYVVTAAQYLKDFRNCSLWTWSHLMTIILSSQNKNTDDLNMIDD